MALNVCFDNLDNKLLFNKLKLYFNNNIEKSLKTKNKLFLITKNKLFYEIDINDKIIQSFILSNDNSIMDEMLVKQLCNKEIIGMSCGSEHYIAITASQEIYLWANNMFGQLANGRQDQHFDDYNKPELNQLLSSLNCHTIESGLRHSLALSQSAQVYGWGSNLFGESNPQSEDQFQFFASKLNGFNSEKIISISCGSMHSMALTESGRVFGWGNNSCGQLGCTQSNRIREPIAVDTNGAIITKISCGPDHSLLLSNDGRIDAFGKMNFMQILNNETIIDSKPMRIKDKGIKFIDILSHYSCAIIGSLSVDGIYYIWKHSEEDFDLEPEETHFKSFDEMLAQTYGISLRLTEGLIDFNDPFLRKQFYCENYSEIQILGKGSFSTVFKAMTKQLLDREIIAMKKIELENKNCILKEFINYSLVHELDPQFIVKQYNSWFEYNYDFNDEKFVLFIEMELCDQTLDYIIEELHNTFTANDALTPLGYYMASQLFIEILEAVNYLHKKNPPLIHRNLKPVNIMLKKQNNTERIIKIADFGLMAINQFTDDSHTSNETTNQYMAPEVIRNKKYDTKADIYSLGQIMQNLFDIDVNRSYDEIDSSKLLSKYRNASDLSLKMKSERYRDRPDCDQILEDKHLWSLSDEQFDFKTDLEVFKANCDKNESYYLISLLQHKYNYCESNAQNLKKKFKK